MTRSCRHNRNAEVDVRGEKRSNATHVSTTDPDARLFKKSPGTGAMLCCPCDRGEGPTSKHGCVEQARLRPAQKENRSPGQTSSAAC